MITYFLDRLKSLCSIGVILTGCLVLLDQTFKIDSMLGVISMVCIISPVALVFVSKPNWFTLWPYSRKGLWLIHVLESFAQMIIVMIFILLLMGYFQLRGQSFDISIKAFIYSGLFGVFLRIGLITKNENKNNKNLWSQREAAAKHIGRVLASITAAGISFYVFGFPHTFLAMILAFAVSIPYAGFLNISSPMILLRKMRLYSYVAFAMIYIAATSFAVNSLWNASLKDPDISVISAFVPKFVTVSDERARQIFMEDVSHAWDRIDKKQILRQINLANWIERTKRCKTWSCLEFSDEVIPNIDVLESKLDAKLLILQRCEALRDCLSEQNIYGRRKWLSAWLNELADSEVLDKWLTGQDTYKQFLAVKSLNGRTITPQQAGFIQTLSGSTDSKVKESASLEMSLSLSRKEDALTCEKNNKCKPGQFLQPISGGDPQ